VPLGDDEIVAELDPDMRLRFEMEGERAIALRLEREGNEQRAPRAE